MAKKQAKSNPLTVLDQSIEIRANDRSRKDLQTWKTALQSAESVVNPIRKLLYDLYEDITLDEHLTSVMDQRRLALANTTLSFQIDGEPVEEIEALIELEFFEELMTGILDSKFYGYSLIQTDFVKHNATLIHRAHVVPSKRLVVATPYDQAGIDYTQAPYNYLCVGAGKDNDLGLLLKAAPLVLMKRGDISDWATFNEVFGQPLRTAEYDPNMPGNKEQLATAMKEMGSNSYAIIPNGSKVTFVSSYQTASAQTYDLFASRMDKALSKLFVGQTMTTEDGSSKSQGEVHERVADKIAKSDQRYVLRYLNGHVRQMLIAQGFPADKGVFKFMEEEARLSKKDRLEMDIRIHKEVAPISIDYFAEEYNVPIDMDAVAAREEPEQEEQEPEEDSEKDKPEAAPNKPGKRTQQAAPDLNGEKRFKQFLNACIGFFGEAPIR